MNDNMKKIKNEIIDNTNDEEVLENYDNRIADVVNEEISNYDKEYTEEINTEENNIEDTIKEESQEEKQKENIIEKMKNFINDFKRKKEQSKIYIDYKVRLIVSCILFGVLIILAIVFAKGAFDLTSSRAINYNESSNLDYKVYLKDNDFYDTSYLGKDKIYVASIIDNILIDFRYRYNIEKESEMNFEYDIVAKLTINDESSGGNFFEKEYVLQEDKKVTLKEATAYRLNEQVKIDYDYYNALANKFKQQYGIDASSDLTVYLKINRQNNVGGSSNAVDTSTMFVKIPLSEKAVNIELNYQDINNSNYIIEINESIVDNVIYGILATICVGISIVVAIKLLKLLKLLNGKKTAYDKYVNKILNEYDRLIVENATGPDLLKNNIIKVSRFEELLDVRDNLKLPIMYYVIAKHNKCCFYIKHNRDLYLLTIKAVDLEENK